MSADAISRERLERLESYVAKIDYDGPPHHIPLDLLEMVPTVERPEARVIETPHGQAVTFAPGDDGAHSETAPTQSQIVSRDEWRARWQSAHSVADMAMAVQMGLQTDLTTISQGDPATTLCDHLYDVLSGMAWARNTLLSTKMGQFEVAFAALAYGQAVLANIREAKSAQSAQVVEAAA